jgi:hypothetical protein
MLMFLTLIGWEILAFLTCAAVIAGFQILTGKINTRGLLRTRPNGPLSATRVQMLFSVAGFALWYLNLIRTTTDYGSLPDVPNAVLLTFAGSHSTYLLGKGFSSLNWQQYLNKNNQA